MTVHQQFDLHGTTWRKSTRSNSTGNGNCVEVGCAHESKAWRKSSRTSSTGNGNCVEASAAPRAIAIRDSKLDTIGDFPVLAMSASDWAGLLDSIREGAFDR